MCGRPLLTVDATNDQRAKPQSAPKFRRPGAVARTSGAKASPQRTQAHTDAGRDACRPPCRNSWFLALHHHPKRPTWHLDHSEHDSVHQTLGPLPLHLAELSSFFPSSLRSAHHHDEPEPSIRDRPQARRTRLSNKCEG